MIRVMDGFIVASGVIALMICAYSFQRDGRQERYGFGRVRVSTRVALIIPGTIVSLCSGWRLNMLLVSLCAHAHHDDASEK
jgi:Mn2+/Fe2+ NRAMP family transporter